MTIKKIVLITGANKGIGNEVARQLLSQGFTVLLGARDLQRGQVAVETLRKDGSDVHFVHIDVTNDQSIKQAAETIAKHWEKVDVLINNAGVNYEFSAKTRPALLSVDILKDTFQTNVFGTFAVIHHFLPLLKQAEAARVINVSSSLGSLASVSDPDSIFHKLNTAAYNASKTALNALTIALAKDLSDEQISVNSICPGWVQTEMGTDAAPRTVEQGAAIIVKLATMNASPTCKFLDEDGEIPW
ncbi:SDR family oxidoreductase [Leptolyngbya sp. AN03gr2]|uniref:SDR family oxidoreductase n=1 Tax=unclassified Leptolyngbya TaxID=2650499 RepID=UPI003D317912